MPRMPCTVAMGLLLASAAATELPKVVLPYGDVQGNRLESVDEFLGIPYAMPPVGGLRFAPPKPWAGQYPGGRLAATQAGAACMQPTHQDKGFGFPMPIFSMQGKAISEDCLYLNVYRPRAAPRPEDSRNGAGRPVMLWIHGGSLLLGTSTLELYNATDLAMQEDVVVVSINYRLNVFGFSPTIEADGTTVANNGWRDQREAMRWVQRHITAFGGDPARVTLFGESAGGQCTVAHLVSPGSAGLFSGVISQSGNIADQLTLDEGLATTTIIAQQVGCAGPADLPCLRNASAESFMRVDLKGARLTAVVDGDFLPGPTLELFEQGKFNKGIPVIMGWNLLDFKLFAYPGFHCPSNKTYPLDKQQTECAFTRSFGDRAQQLMDVYPPRRSWGIFDNRDLVVELTTDVMFACPARWAARMLASNGASSWVYSFRMQPACSPIVFPGPVHGAEIAYVFGNQEKVAGIYNRDQHAACHVSPQDKALSRIMMHLWGTFARQGAPPAEWPSWSAERDPVLKLELSSLSRLGTETGFRNGQCTALKSAGVNMANATPALIMSVLACQGPRRLAERAPPVLV